MLKRLDWDKERAQRDARAFAERAIEVLPAEASPERSKGHYAAEMVLRDLSYPNRGRGRRTPGSQRRAWSGCGTPA